MDIRNKSVMITGGSSGIGLEIAKAFLAQGANVMICGQDPAQLDAVRKEYPAIGAYLCDLADTTQLRELIIKTGENIDIWVNNAGLFLQYHFLLPDQPFERLQKELQVNFVAASLAICEMVPLLSKKRESAIVNITAGMIYTPLVKNPMYNASKAALHSFLVSARRQVASTGIRIIEIVPPMVSTKLTEGMKGKRVAPAVIAKAVLKALRSDKDMILVGQARSLALMSKLFPGLMLRLVNDGIG